MNTSAQEVDSVRRATVIVHRRFLEISTQIDTLPEATQVKFVAYIWAKIGKFLTLWPDEMQNPSHVLTLDRCQALHKFLDVFERMVELETEGVGLDQSISSKGLPEIAELFRERRHAVFEK